MTQDQAIALSQNRLLIHGTVTKETLAYIAASVWVLAARNSPTVSIHIMSVGGDVTPGLDVYDLLRFYTGRKLGIVHSVANSVSSVILQACDWRVITPNSKLFVHHLVSTHYPLDVARNPVRQARFVADMEATQARLDRVYLAKTDLSPADLRQLCELCVELSASEALTLGFVDQILDTLYEIEPTPAVST